MIKPSRVLPFFISGVMLLSGCDRESTPSTTATPTAATAPSHPLPDPIPDQSLPANDYISLGMPSHDRDWLGQEMAVAASKLQALATQSPEKLPRMGSDRSGPVFARIVSPDNLKFFRSRSLPLSSRFPQAIDYAESQSAILKMYLSAHSANKVTGAELVELMGAQLRTVVVVLELVDEFLPTLSKDDPKYPVRMAGLDQMRQGLVGTVSGVITTLTEAQVYDVGTRGKLLEYCRETFPHIVPKLSAPSQQEVLRRLGELTNDPSVRDLRSEVMLLRDEVHAATKSGG